MRRGTIALALGGVLAMAAVADAANESPGWKTALAPGKTAVDGALRIFARATLEGDDLVLQVDKELRLPGTSQERAWLPAGTRLGVPSTLSIETQRGRYLVLLWQGSRAESQYELTGGFGDEVAVLAVFPEGSGEPTDVAEVKQDRFTWITKEGVPRLAGDEAFTVVNHHANAGQPYYITALFQLIDGRLRRVAESFTVSEMGGCARSFTQATSWTAIPRAGHDYPDVTATVTEVTAPAEYTRDCEGRMPKPRTRTASETYSWDQAKQRYVLLRRTGGPLHEP